MKVPKNGTFVSYYDNGNLLVESNYLNSKLDGKYMDFHVDGTTWMQCHYTNGEINGEYIYHYYLGGKPSKHSFYCNGEVIVNLLEDPRDEIGMFELQLIHGGQLL